MEMGGLSEGREGLTRSKAERLVRQSRGVKILERDKEWRICCGRGGEGGALIIVILSSLQHFSCSLLQKCGILVFLT